MMDLLTKHLFELMFALLCAAFSGAAAYCGKMFKKQKALENGIKALLYARISDVYDTTSHRGYINMYELKNIQTVHDAYHNLGGNGACNEIYSRISSLPLQASNTKKEDENAEHNYNS